MKKEGVDAVRALAERRAGAKTLWKKRVFGNQVVGGESWRQ
jgi:hypothetical protein